MVSLGCCSATACAYAGIAQLVEQLIRNQQVVSSSLISSSRLPRTDFVRGSFFLKSRLRRGLKFPKKGCTAACNFPAFAPYR